MRYGTMLFCALWLGLAVPELADGQTKKDSAIYYQHKGMFLFKARKYEAGLPYLDTAVMYDPKGYTEYRAFMKCVFQKSYVAALVDFNAALALQGNVYIMDHPYYFYMSLCYLQLNKFDSADYYMARCVNEERRARTDGSVHYLHMFYTGIIHMERKEYAAALASLDSSLAQYPTFADAQYYKALLLRHAEKNDESLKVLNEAAANLKLGYSMNEDNAIYEKYPYQVTESQLSYAIQHFVPKTGNN